ncbi:cellulose biosynthesis cyclic di-GMP-binding regulatory protein BcsB [Sutterella sp.]|uniref:cellulose biosynthesis cyclic di-GMP-binding regulatory protein BcsB n=1 Tax=Sutterella sp. TaxID=1981025 RepID=UPI0026DF5312|nr:cellulose biosynthesis cyclic di-GMP-binding regulatory protein BcsB [Sutterella sp.]MDO5531233.1 cellulose biosynthesis cyclic di-GMP-binding regulatory protein BcsB [Sutterella sp.]
MLGALLALGLASTGIEAAPAATAPVTPAENAAAPAEPQGPAFMRLDEALLAPPVLREEALPPVMTFTPISRLALGGPADSMRFTGVFTTRSFRLVMRRDEIITRAELKLVWTPSPSLLPIRSQVLVRLNGQLAEAIPITKEGLGKQNTSTVVLDPKKLKDDNSIEIEFVGEYAHVCATPTSPTLWLAVDNSSTLTLAHQKIRVADELGLLPAPFIDPADLAQVVVPVALPENPDGPMLSAAAVVTSWLGALADWRGSRFPVKINAQPPEGHFVVFMTKDSRPEFLKDWPEPKGPEIALADAPYSPWAKMLVISGRTTEELITAAQSLATARAVLSGPRALVTRAAEILPREPWDAPKWIDTTRPTKFSELVEYPGQLTSRGVQPWPVRLNFRLPPDLFVMTRSSVPVDLHYRTTKPEENVPAELRFRVNGAIADTIPITSVEPVRAIERIPVVESIAELFRSLNAPTLFFDAVNTLEFDYALGLSIQGGNEENCRTVTLLEAQLDIDPRSEIDFTGFYHFAELPDLRLFTRSGFPFSKMADLSETVLAMSAAPSATEIETMLGAVGRISANTGAAALKANVILAPDSAALADRDILVTGPLPESVAAASTDAVPGVLTEDVTRRLVTNRAGLNDDQASPERRAASRVTDFRARGPIAAIVGFESPVTPGRSVVALLGNNDEGLVRLSESISDPARLMDASGAVTLLGENGLQNYHTAPTYYVGSLPWHQRVWHAMLEHPVLLILCAILCAILIGCVVYALMHIRIRSRLAAPAAGGKK